MLNVGRRKWMIALREKLGIDRERMATLCKCTPGLLELLEEHNAITQPKIASRIAHRYGMDVEQYNQLVHPEKKAKVLPAWRNPTSGRTFTWSRYYQEHVAREAEVI